MLRKVRIDMGFYDVLKDVSKRSCVPLVSISERMGRNSAYVSTAIARGSVPSVDNAAAMLDACGWSLAAVPSDDVPPSALVIAPPDADGDAGRRALERKRARLAAELAAVDEALA